MRNRPPNDHQRLPAEARLGLLLEHDHALAGFDEFGGGDEPGEAGSDDDGVGVVRHPVLFPS